MKNGPIFLFLRKILCFRHFAVRNLWRTRKNLTRRCIFRIIWLRCLCFAPGIGHGVAVACLFSGLRRHVDNGASVAENLVDGFTKSMQAIRLRSDGKVDPDTVDGRVRATTLAVCAMKYREDAKKASTLPSPLPSR